MAKFTITIEEKNNLPPDVIGSIFLDVENGGIITFTSDDFTTKTNPQYSDPEGDDPLDLKILNYNTTSSHKVTYEAIEVVENQEIPFTDIIMGKLKFVSDSSILTEDSYSFEFTISDTGSETFSDVSGKVDILIHSQRNLPPSSVGDGETTVSDDNIIVFTEQMFTATTPAYSDPESDPPGRLKILSIPQNGSILLRGIEVQANEVIDFDEINAGKLIFQPDDVDETTIDSFEFQIADVGSNVFVG